MSFIISLSRGSPQPITIIVTTFMKTQTELISFFYYMKISIDCKSFFILIKDEGGGRGGGGSEKESRLNCLDTFVLDEMPSILL